MQNKIMPFEKDNHNYNENLEMATTLYWRPLCDNEDPIDKTLKYILMEEDMLINSMLTTKDLGFLKGIKAAANVLNQKDLQRSAENLIEAVERFGAIQLHEK
jgi:hypothetical protein